MPTYQYACTSPQCDLRFERVQAFTDPAISECPDCSERVRKVYGSVGVVFKGSGFYRNDSRDAKTGASAKSDSDGAAAKNGDGAKDAGKSDAKGAGAKSEAGSGSAKSADSAGSAKGSGESSAKGKTESAKPAATVAG
jgi:putative FmdB family regulatory protein